MTLKVIDNQYGRLS